VTEVNCLLRTFIICTYSLIVIDDIREDVMGVECSMHGTDRDLILIGEREGKRPLGKSCRSSEDNIKTHAKEIRWEVME
jgi:hypothetical protein